MKPNVFLLFVFVMVQLASRAQNDTIAWRPFYGGFQICGQNAFSLFHEFEFLSKSSFKLHTHLQAGINNMGKKVAAEVKARPIYGFQAGVLGLIGKRSLVGEVGILPAIYAYKVAFVNINGWIGLRLNANVGEDIFLSLGYTPRLYTSYSDADHRYFNAQIGFKFGVNF